MKHLGNDLDVSSFAKNLWGHIYYHHNEGNFEREPPDNDNGGDVSFVHFILKPLYKIYSKVTGDEKKSEIIHL